MSSPSLRKAGEDLVKKMVEVQSLYRDLEIKNNELRNLRQQSNTMYNNNRDNFTHQDYRSLAQSSLGPSNERRLSLGPANKQMRFAPDTKPPDEFTPREFTSSYERDIQQRFDYQLSKLEEKLKRNENDHEQTKRDLKHEIHLKKVLEKASKEHEEEKKALNAKLSTAKGKLGVAHSSLNVVRHDIENLKTKQAEDQVTIARLEERLAAALKELEKFKDIEPSMRLGMNPDKKEIRRLKQEVEKADERRKIAEGNIESKDEEVRQMKFQIALSKEKQQNLQNELDLSNVFLEEERRDKADIEEKLRKLTLEKKNFDDKLNDYKVKMGIKAAGFNVNKKTNEELKQQVKEYEKRFRKMELKMKEMQLEIERMSNKGMPGQTATSIKEHQFRKQRLGRSVSPPLVRSPRSVTSPAKSAQSSSINSLDSVAISMTSGQSNASTVSGKKTATRLSMTNKASNMSPSLSALNKKVNTNNFKTPPIGFADDSSGKGKGSPKITPRQATIQQSQHAFSTGNPNRSPRNPPYTFSSK